MKLKEIINYIMNNNKFNPFNLDNKYKILLSEENIFGFSNFGNSSIMENILQYPELENNNLIFSSQDGLPMYCININDNMVYAMNYTGKMDRIVNLNIIIYFYFQTKYVIYQNLAIETIESFGDNQVAWEEVNNLKKEIYDDFSNISKIFEHKEINPFWEDAINNLIPF